MICDNCGHEVLWGKSFVDEFLSKLSDSIAEAYAKLGSGESGVGGNEIVDNSSDTEPGVDTSASGQLDFDDVHQDTIDGLQGH